MTLLTSRKKRRILQTMVAPRADYLDVYTGEATDFWNVAGDTFNLVLDENLSISAGLNNEGFANRRHQVRALADSGAINIDKYTNRRGRVNYDFLARDYSELGIKSDKELSEEKAEVLKQRRERTELVQERGSGFAQFLGSLAGYMVDPLVIATIPYSTAGAALKGLSLLGRTMMVAKNEAILGVVSELAIQPLVSHYKHDINSPYEMEDALQSIVMAGAGAAALGGIVGGISGYIGKVREKTALLDLEKDLIERFPSTFKGLMELSPEERAATLKSLGESLGEDVLNETQLGQLMNKMEIDEEGKTALKILKDFEEELKANPEKRKFDSATVKEDYLNALKFELMTIASRSIQKSDGSIEYTLQKGSIETKVKEDYIVELKKDISNLEQGKKLSEKRQQELWKQTFIAEAEIDIKYLKEKQKKTKEFNEPKSVDRTEPEKPKVIKLKSGTASQKEKEVISNMDGAEEYGNLLAEVEGLEDATFIKGGEVVNTKQYMKNIDNDLAGIDSILECSIGKL
tara:strand:+ start:87 stop:1640 length:1554 start_codon:yes stop_codon:yes gene_type:complete